MTPGFAHAAVPHGIADAPRLGTDFSIGLAHTEREVILAVLAVIDVTKICLDLAREKELVGGRENSQGTAVRFQNSQSIPRPQTHWILIHRTTECVTLPSARRIAPDQLGVLAHAKTLQSANVFVRRGCFRSFGDDFLPHQIRAPVDGVQQRAGENTGFQSGERNLEPCAIGLHLASGGAVFRPRPRNLFGLPRQIYVCAAAARHHERRVPECIPFFALNYGRGQRNAELFQWSDLLLR